MGNSTSQTLDPDRLNALTGLRFGQAAVPGTGPLEQTAMLEYLGRTRGAGVRAVVLGLDFTWCDAGWMTKGRNPFPLWLYDASLGRYLAGLFRFNSIEALQKRIAALAGYEKPPREDGFWNYELHVPAAPLSYGTPHVAKATDAGRSAARPSAAGWPRSRRRRRRRSCFRRSTVGPTMRAASTPPRGPRPAAPN